MVYVVVVLFSLFVVAGEVLVTKVGGVHDGGFDDRGHGALGGQGRLLGEYSLSVGSIAAVHDHFRRHIEHSGHAGISLSDGRVERLLLIGRVRHYHLVRGPI